MDSAFAASSRHTGPSQSRASPRSDTLHHRWQGAGRLPPPGTLHHRVRSAPEDRDLQEVDNTLLRDIERYQQREQQQNLRAGLDPRPLREEDGAAAINGIKELLDKVLIADFFFVCAALAWLLAGVGAKAALDSSALLDAWFPLWQWVFQPAIGVLMLGAILSGLVGRLSQQE